MPALYCAKGNGAGASWVGIDGANNAVAEQEGLTFSCNKGVQSDSLWYQNYPANPVRVPMRVYPNDWMWLVETSSGHRYPLQLAGRDSRRQLRDPHNCTVLPGPVGRVDHRVPGSALPARGDIDRPSRRLLERGRDQQQRADLRGQRELVHPRPDGHRSQELDQRGDGAEPKVTKAAARPGSVAVRFLLVGLLAQCWRSAARCRGARGH